MITPVDNCECTIPEGGWCKYHEVSKSAHWVQLCIHRPQYRQAWNAGRGPGQNIQKQRDEYLLRPQDNGPGSELRRAMGCSESRRSKVDFGKMNRWGIDGCRARIQDIVAVMAERIAEDKATRLVEIAIARSEQKTKGMEHGN